MSSPIGRSSQSGYATAPDFHRGEASPAARGRGRGGEASIPDGAGAAPPRDVERRSRENFRGGGPEPGESPETVALGGGPERRRQFRGGGPRPVESPETVQLGGGPERPEPVRGGGPSPVRWGDVDEATGVRGVQIEYESKETAALEVKTDDGDTVSISFEALSRIHAGAYSAQIDGTGASARTLSAESSLRVQVKVEGTLDDEEAGQTGELLERLVSTARSDEPKAIQTGGLESLDSFQFAYDAYRRAGLAMLDAQFG